ncbi:undecaprenyldiphospho-muramoylpentapeptide beta-N-acetylglucosaminyltransferase [Candidatus Bipolaricaulota bacterium]|nr:undecaprenyldiphospho-muramoylpentapeptide beta-N-acetylglucosaminyltransferase [Candidatus Bipolaricaulota bacterium]
MRVLVAGGGTGGHFYPALAVMEALKKDDPAIELGYVGTRRGIEARILPSYPWIRFFPIHARGISRESVGKGIYAVFLLFVAFIETALVFLRFRPQLVIGMGGYASFAPLFLGSLLGRVIPIRTVIHEQNLVAGLTNRILSRFVDKVLVSYPRTREDFPHARRVVVTGNPIREEFLLSKRSEAAYRRFGLVPGKKTVLVFGGSRGSSTLVRALLQKIDAIAADGELQVLLVTGDAEDENAIRKAFADEGVKNVIVRRYIDRMGEAFALADLIVSRAGATTLAEITSCGKPALLVPWPGAAEDHQRRNARYLAAAGACAVAEEDELLEEGLAPVIEAMVRDEVRLNRIGRNAAQVGQRSAVRLILGEIESLARGEAQT